jgi:aryl-alcohol dehydrogenase-like predicted oxidoreductase
MREVVLGRSGIRISEICLGTMMLGMEASWRPTADEATARKVYEAYREAGGNFIDTANVYGASEERLGAMIAADEREALVIATKFTLETDLADPNTSGGHRKNLRRSLDESLRRLGTDYVDLLWVHAWDQRTPVEETMRALDDVVRSGKVLAIGVSNTPAWVVSRAMTLADQHGWTPYSAQQLEYSLAARTPEHEALPMGRAYGMTTTAWGPLARGALAGRDTTSAKPRATEIGQVVVEVAREVGATPAQVALAWLLVQGIVPIVGATRVEQIEDSLGASGLVLAAEHVERLTTASAIDLSYPHTLLAYKTDTLGPL